MKSYHIAYKRDVYSIATGVNYLADNELKALEYFRLEYPEAVFIYICCREMLNFK